MYVVAKPGRRCNRIDDVLAEMPGMGRGKAHPADSWNLSDGVQQFRKSHLP